MAELTVLDQKISYFKIEDEDYISITDMPSGHPPCPVSPTEDPDLCGRSDHMQRSACRSDGADQAS